MTGTAPTVSYPFPEADCGQLVLGPRCAIKETGGGDDGQNEGCEAGPCPRTFAQTIPLLGAFLLSS